MVCSPPRRRCCACWRPSCFFREVRLLGQAGYPSIPFLGIAIAVGVVVDGAIPTNLDGSGLILVANAWLNRPQLTPLFLLVWLAVVFVVNRLLLRPVCALLARRRENLGLVVG